jgi:hypothetical protein
VKFSARASGAVKQAGFTGRAAAAENFTAQPAENF